MIKKLILMAILFVWLCVGGCNAKNAEVKRWDSKGKLRYHARTGQVNVLYWFAINSGRAVIDPNRIDITASGLQEKPDADAIKASGTAVGAGIRTVFTEP